MSRILITGAHGQVGQELQRTLAPLGDVVAAGRDQANLADPDQLRQTVRALHPELIVNAAAYTAVDRAESEPELADIINGIAPAVLAEESERLGATLIHISTDYVFDGTKNTPYLEDDATHPVSAYGRSKQMGEVGIQQANDSDLARHLIIRTAWVYGTYGQSNFVKTMLRLGAEREEIRVVADQVGSPTWSKDLAKAIAGFAVRCLSASSALPIELLEPSQTAPSGIFNVTNSGVASWYDFAVAIFEEAEALGFPVKVRRVVPIATADYPTPAKRPAYSVLSGHKTAGILGEYAPHWRQGLRQMLTELYSYTYESNYSVGR